MTLAAEGDGMALRLALHHLADHRHARPKGIFRQVVGDEGADAAPGFQVAFGQQAFISQHHRVARDRKLLGQHSRGGDAGPGLHSTVQDKFPDLFEDLALQSLAAGGADVDGKLHWITKPQPGADRPRTGPGHRGS